MTEATEDLARQLDEGPYSKTQITKTFGPDALDFITLGATLGWRVVFNSTGTSITLIPHNDLPGQRIHLSSKNKGNGGALRKRSRRLIRYGDPDMVRRAAKVNALPDELQSMGWSFLMETTVPEENFRVMDPEPTPVTLVSQRPALMHRGRGRSQVGKSYPSQTTTERTWSDGTVDYTCIACGATSKNRRAFGGSHWAAHVRRGEAQPMSDERDLVVDPAYTKPTFTKGSPVKNLTALIESLDLTALTAEELATLILEHLAETGATLPTPSTPLTDEQILDRIRRMVDRGKYAEQEEEIRQRDQQLHDLTQSATDREQELLDKVSETERQLAETHSNVQSVYELLQGVIPTARQGGTDDE